MRPREAQATSEVFEDWLGRYAAAWDAADPRLIAGFFAADGYWRDIAGLAWDLRTYSGRNEIERAVRAAFPAAKPHNLRPARDRMPPRITRRSRRTVLEGFFDFDTRVGRGTGFVRLLFEGEDPASEIWLQLTALQELRGFEERLGARRPIGTEYSYGFGGKNWLDRRREATAYDTHDPEVLIIGGGQAGLSLGARLTQIGVDCLIVEQNPRIGDNWRNRYHSLTLHNETWANSLPYLEFPPTWPTFLPKDKLAGWLESYAEFMELNVWTGTTFRRGQFDDTTATWSAQLARRDGSTRTVTVPHIVLATGSISGNPRIPSLPGIADFAGEVMHSSRFVGGKRYGGAHAIVVGTGNSGHDVAQELHSHGARVSIVQRSPTTVVSLEPSGTLVYALYSEGPAEDIDFITAAIPYPLLKQAYQGLTQRTCALDKELLDRLAKVGFETDFGHDDTGFHMKYLRQGGGYYINVGCSELIADGKVRLLHARDMSTFTAKGLRLIDGELVPADLVVLATGYENQQETVRRMFGESVAETVGPIWGLDESGYQRGMWRPTGQEGFWVMGGGLSECRFYSKILALFIKGQIEGLLPRPSTN